MAIISGNYSPFHESSKKSSTPPKEMALMDVYVLWLSPLGDMRSRLLLDKDCAHNGIANCIFFLTMYYFTFT